MNEISTDLNSTDKNSSSTVQNPTLEQPQPRYSIIWKQILQQWLPPYFPPPDIGELYPFPHRIPQSRNPPDEFHDPDNDLHERLTDLARFRSQFSSPTREFYKAKRYSTKLQVLGKLHLVQELTELHASWLVIYDQPERDMPAIRSFLMQAYDKLNLQVFESVIPSPSHSIIALDGHFKEPMDRSFHIIMDLLPQDSTDPTLLITSPNFLRVWDTNKIVGPFGTLGYNE